MSKRMTLREAVERLQPYGMTGRPEDLAYDMSTLLDLIAELGDRCERLEEALVAVEEDKPPRRRFWLW